MARAQDIGLGIEKIAERLTELERTAHEGTAAFRRSLARCPMAWWSWMKAVEFKW